MIYFDTSCLLPLILEEPTSRRIEEVLKSQGRETLATSQWARVEVSSALGRYVRMRKLTGSIAKSLETEFDHIVSESFSMLVPGAGDFRLAVEYLQHHDSGLRAGDALHLAMAVNHGASDIYSFDKTLSESGRRLGLPVRTIDSRT